jgi:lipopolysaccharide biosynthesis regulator YciM
MTHCKQIAVLILCSASVHSLTGLSQSASSTGIEVFQSYGDLVVREGAEQRRLIIPSEMRSHPRFVIRTKRSNEALALTNPQREPSTEDKVNARKVMYQANQAFFKGEIEKAWQLVEEAENLDPDFYRIKSMKGSLLFKIGSKELAVDLWRDSLTKNPDQPEIRAMLEKTEKEL